jgi:hypothetical protein
MYTYHTYIHTTYTRACEACDTYIHTCVHTYTNQPCSTGHLGLLPALLRRLREARNASSSSDKHDVLPRIATSLSADSARVSTNSLNGGVGEAETASPSLTHHDSAVELWGSFDLCAQSEYDADAVASSASGGFPLSDDFMSGMIVRHADR